jgi:hypothetical protein
MEACYLPSLAELELSPQVELGAEFKRESPRSPAVSPPLEARAPALCLAHGKSVQTHGAVATAGAASAFSESVAGLFSLAAGPSQQFVV